MNNRLKGVRRIGGGIHGIVYTAFDHKNKEMVALKVIKLSHGSGVGGSHVREISLLKSLPLHSNIVALRATIMEEDRVYLILELLEMDLRSYLSLQPHKLLPEDLVRVKYQF